MGSSSPCIPGRGEVGYRQGDRSPPPPPPPLPARAHPAKPHAQLHPERSIRPGTKKPLPTAGRPGRVRSRGRPPDCGRRAPSRPAPPLARHPPRSRRVLRSAARPPQPYSPPPRARAPAHSRGRQWRRLHCGSSRASERRQRPPPPAPYQPRTPALSARPAPFHPPRGGAALLTARHHLRRRPPRPWPVGPARSCAWRGSRAPPSAGRRRRRRRRRDRRAGERAARPLPGSPGRRRRRDGRALRPPAAEGPLPRRRPFLRGVWRRRRRADGRARARGGGSRPGAEAGSSEAGRARAEGVLSGAPLALIHRCVHILVLASECLPHPRGDAGEGRPFTAFPKGETEARRDRSA